MALKKSELYSSLWKSCDELRGGMDASQYKDYVLVLLFVKYVSDKYAGRTNAMLEVPVGGSFADMVALKGNKEIGEGIDKIIAKLAEANDLRGVIDVAGFNDSDKLGKGPEMVDRLSNLIGIFEGLDFRRNRAEGDDLLGDAYEYLMRHFATESGKSKGQFYTPAEVSRIMAKVIGIGAAKRSDQTIYDPTCGSGSLLLRAHDEAKASTGLDLSIYGQERENTNSALAKMNMILHDCTTAEIWQDNTLSHPYFKDGNGGLKRFDFAVANPPFSDGAWSSGLNPAKDEFKRFVHGTPPTKNGDYAFLLHVLASLKSTGKGAIILPHGVLFRGNAEANIRRNIINQGFIKGIIGLPPNLFFGTGIPACIIVLDKENAAFRKGIFMIDASKGFAKDGNKNRLRAQDIHKIVDTFTHQTSIDGYARMVPLDEIEKNEFNLNILRYIDSSESEDLQDIDAHLCGGIPNRDIEALKRYWDAFPALRDILFEAERPGYSRLKLDITEIKAAIFSHAEFTSFKEHVAALFNGWRAANEPRLYEIAPGVQPRLLIERLSEDLLATFTKIPLLDAYDVYQHLLDYWEETMQDDAYLIASEGWAKAGKLRLMVEDKAKKGKEKADFTIGKQKFKAELVPPPLIIARYYATEQATIEALETEAASVTQGLNELKEEHGGEEGLLESVKDEKGNIVKAAVVARLKEIKNDTDAADEYEVLQRYIVLAEKEAVATRKVKDAKAALEGKVFVKYSKLSEDEIKSLVINDKWLGALNAAVQSEMERVSQALARRIKQLAERYRSPLPEIEKDVVCLTARVVEHLQQMGASWN